MKKKGISDSLLRCFQVFKLGVGFVYEEKKHLEGANFAIFKLVMFQGQNYIIASLKRKVT